jgi:hypothetical protein
LWLGAGAPLQGVGKRAAFALYYGPLHFLLIREIVRGLGAADKGVRPIVDLGCGTGDAGAAWALEFPRPPRLVGVDAALGDRRGCGPPRARASAHTVRNDGPPLRRAQPSSPYCLNELDRGRAACARLADAASAAPCSP